MTLEVANLITTIGIEAKTLNELQAWCSHVKVRPNPDLEEERKGYMATTSLSCSIRQAQRRRFWRSYGASAFVILQTFALHAASTPNQGVGNNIHDGDGKSATAGSSASAVSDKGAQVNVKAYGAVGDGVTNDTAAFNKALAACAVSGGTCLVPEGKYLISASGISTAPHRPSVLSGVHLIGSGQASILKIAGMPTDHFLPCEGDNWSVENLTFDMGDYTSAGLAAISCKGNYWRVANCAITKSGKWAIIAFGGKNWLIERNHVTRTVPGARPPIGAILVTKQGDLWSSHGRVIGNVCEGAGITFAGANGVIASNRISRSGYGSGIFVQGAPSTRSATITGNICSEGSSGYDDSQAGKWWSVNGFEVWAPDSIICNNIAHDNDGGGFAIGGPNSIVIGNKAYNNGRGHHGYAGFNARINVVKGTSASHSIFIANSSHDQDFGYKEQGAGISDIKQIGNDYNRNRIGPAKSFGAGGQMPISAEMKAKLKALAEDPDVPDSARRAVHAWLAK